MERMKGKNILLFPKDCCIIDIETTGLDPQYCEIIEMAALKIRNGNIIARFSELVKPNHPVDFFITALTGITNDMLEDAPLASDVIPAFRDFIGNDILVGHHVNFDINFIYDYSEKLLLPVFSNDFIDTMRIARIVLPQLAHHRLRDLVNHYQIINPNAHRAEGDCIATLELLRRLQEDADIKKIDLSQYPLKKHYNRGSHNKLRAKELSPQTDSFDETHPLYGKLCAFTGTLKMPRRDAMQLVLNVGGQCGDNVTQKTDYLIIGNTEYCSNMRSQKTGKMKRAEELILQGNDLTIISESVFYDLIEGSSNVDPGFDEDKTELPADDDNDTGNYNRLIELIQKMLDQTEKEINLPDGFFQFVKNQKSHSLWIVEPMTKSRSQLVLTVEKRGKVGQKYGRIIAKKTALDKIAAQEFTVSKNDPTLAFLDIIDIRTEYTDQLRKLIQYCAENFTPSERFGCCDLYKKCSFAGECLHHDQFYSRACWYRKNLESGKVFY